MSPNHHGYYENAHLAEADCWCQPLVEWPHDELDPGIFGPVVWHRPDPGVLFWHRGEQGPQPLRGMHIDLASGRDFTAHTIVQSTPEGFRMSSQLTPEQIKAIAAIPNACDDMVVMGDVTFRDDGKFMPTETPAQALLASPPVPRPAWALTVHPQIKKGELPPDCREPATEDGPHRMSFCARWGDNSFHLGIEVEATVDEDLRKELASHTLEYLCTAAPDLEGAIKNHIPRIEGRQQLEFTKLTPKTAPAMGAIQTHARELRALERQSSARRATVYAPKVNSRYQREQLARQGIAITEAGLVDPRGRKP